MMCLSQLEDAPEKSRLKNQESISDFFFFISLAHLLNFWKFIETVSQNHVYQGAFYSNGSY